MIDYVVRCIQEHFKGRKRGIRKHVFQEGCTGVQSPFCHSYSKIVHLVCLIHQPFMNCGNWAFFLRLNQGNTSTGILWLLIHGQQGEQPLFPSIWKLCSNLGRKNHLQPNCRLFCFLGPLLRIFLINKVISSLFVPYWYFFCLSFAAYGIYFILMDIHSMLTHWSLVAILILVGLLYS